MSVIFRKVMVAFVFLLMTGVPYVGPLFAVLCALWVLKIMFLSYDAVQHFRKEGFTESEFHNYPH